MVAVPDADSLTCIVPSDGNYWPFGGQPTPMVPGEVSPPSSTRGGGGLDTGAKIGIGIGLTAAVILFALIAWFLRKWQLDRRIRKHPVHGFGKGGSRIR